MSLVANLVFLLFAGIIGAISYKIIQGWNENVELIDILNLIKEEKTESRYKIIRISPGDLDGTLQRQLLNIISGENRNGSRLFAILSNYSNVGIDTILNMEKWEEKNGEEQKDSPPHGYYPLLEYALENQNERYKVYFNINGKKWENNYLLTNDDRVIKLIISLPKNDKSSKVEVLNSSGTKLLEEINCIKNTFIGNGNRDTSPIKSDSNLNKILTRIDFKPVASFK